MSALLDSAIFLVIAYGVNAATHGAYALTIGKIEVSLLTLSVLALVFRGWRPRLVARRDHPFAEPPQPRG